MNEDRMNSPASLGALWYGLLGGPVVMFLHGAVNFVMIPWACGAGKQSALWLSSIIGILVAGSAIFVAYRKWLEAGAEWDPTQDFGPVPRGRFMAIVGMAVSAMCMLVIIADGIAAMFLGACQ